MVREVTAERLPRGGGVLPWWPLGLMTGYAVLAAALLLSSLLPPEQRLVLWVWSTLPAHATTICCGLLVVRGAVRSRHRRRGWMLVVAALVVSFVGTVLWAWDWTRSGGVAPHTGDPIYLLVYPSLGMLGLYFFLRDLGGPVRRIGVLLDTLALALGFGAALWCFVIVPTAPPGAGAMSVLDVAIRSGALILPAVSAGIVYTHVSDWRAERGLGCLLVAAALTFCGDMLWAGRAVPDRLDEAAVYNLLYLAANVVCTLALCLETRTRPLQAPRSRAQSYSLMPALIILGCLIVLVATGRPLADPPQHIALGMLIAATAVLALREGIAYRDRRQTERERDAAAAVLDHDASDRAQLFDQVHEGVAQELAGLRMALTASANDPSQAPQSLRTAIEQLGQTITNTREIASRLAPLQSARGSLRLALEALSADAAAHGLPCRLHAGNLDEDIPPAASDLIHRIARHTIESVRGDETLQSLLVQLAPGDEAVALDVRARTSSHVDSVFGHPGWSPLLDRLHVAGGQAKGAATADGWWFTVRVPLLVAGARNG